MTAADEKSDPRRAAAIPRAPRTSRRTVRGIRRSVGRESRHEIHRSTLVSPLRRELRPCVFCTVPSVILSEELSTNHFSSDSKNQNHHSVRLSWSKFRLTRFAKTASKQKMRYLFFFVLVEIYKLIRRLRFILNKLKCPDKTFYSFELFFFDLILLKNFLLYFFGLYAQFVE